MYDIPDWAVGMWSTVIGTTPLIYANIAGLDRLGEDDINRVWVEMCILTGRVTYNSVKQRRASAVVP